jgi:hypothetical protein
VDYYLVEQLLKSLAQEYKNRIEEHFQRQKRLERDADFHPSP